MAEVEETKSATGGRSAAYPFIPLDKALARAEALRKAIGKSDTRVVSAMHHWGYGEKSSGGIQTAAALKHFGLVDDSGSGKERRLKLSELAIRILLDQRPDSQERKQLVQRSALMPKMHQELWERWGRDLPVDAEIRHYLLLDRGFNENGADDLIKEYKATISYAGLLDDATISPDLEDINMPEPTLPSGRMPPRKIHIPGASADAGGKEIKDDFSVLLQGNRLKINATVDADGIARLKQMLDKYEEILKLLQ